MKWPQTIIDKGNQILNTLDFTNVTPNKENALRFFEMNPSDIKVVIIGQDPYPTQGVANGRAFAVNKGNKLPQSLKNIFKEIVEVQGFVNTDETLDSWAAQGVLMLNTALTTIIGQPNAHKSLWQNYTKEIIDWLDTNFNITWVLWGNEAIKVGKDLKGEKIIDAHPSPLSVRHRNKNTFKILNNIKW